MEALIEAQFPVAAENARGWLALEEAVLLGDAALVKLLYMAMLVALKREMQAKKADLVRELAAMPDYQLSVSPLVQSPSPT